jgi:hypothetical protein
MLSIEDIQKKNLCRKCDPAICHNKFELCPYQYNPDVHLCLTCKDLNNEIVDGYLKCYHTCKYRKGKEGGLDKWLKPNPKKKKKK